MSADALDPVSSSPIREEALVDSAGEEELLKTPERQAPGNAAGAASSPRHQPPTVQTPELPPDSTTFDSPTGELNGASGGAPERPVLGNPYPKCLSSAEPTSTSAAVPDAPSPSAPGADDPSSTIPVPNIPEPVIKPAASVNGVPKPGKRSSRSLQGNLDQIVRKLSGVADPTRTANGHTDNKTEPHERLTPANGASERLAPVNGAFDLPKSALDLTTCRRDDDEDAQFKAVKWGIMKKKSDVVKEPRKKAPTKKGTSVQQAPAPELFAPPPPALQVLRIPQYVPQSQQDPKFRSEIRLSGLTGGATVVTHAQNHPLPLPSPEEKKLYDKRFEVRPTALVNPFPGGEASSSRGPFPSAGRQFSGAAKGSQIDVDLTRAYDLSGAVNGAPAPWNAPKSLAEPDLEKKRLQAAAGKKSSRRLGQEGVSEFHKALASAFAASSRAAPGAMCPTPGTMCAAPVTMCAAPAAMCSAPVMPVPPPPGISLSLRPPVPSTRVRGAAKRKRGALRNMLVQMVRQTPQSGPQMSTGGTQTEVPVLHQLLGSKTQAQDSFSMANMLGGSGGAVSVTTVDASRSGPVTDPSVVDRLKRLGTVIEVEEDPNQAADKEPSSGAPSALKMLEKMTMDPPQSPVVSALDDRPLFLGKDISVFAKKKGTSFIHPSPNAPLSIIPLGGPLPPPVLPGPPSVMSAPPPLTIESKVTPQSKVQPPVKAVPSKTHHNKVPPPQSYPHPQQTVPHLPLLTITKAASKAPQTAPEPNQVTSQILPPPIVTVTKTTFTCSTVEQESQHDKEIRPVEKTIETATATEPLSDYVPLPFLEPVIVLSEDESPLSADGTYIFKHDSSHSVELPNDQKVFSCDICSAAFHHLHMLRKHYFRLHVARKYISEKDLEAYNIDPEKADDCNDENIYRCHTCRQCLPTKAELKSHLTDHPPVADLNKHIKGAKDYRCERCNAHFKWRKMFGKHKKSCRAPVSAKPPVAPSKEANVSVPEEIVSDESPTKNEPITAVTELALRQVIDTRALRNLHRSAKTARQPKPQRKTRQTVAMAIHSPPEAPELDEVFEVTKNREKHSVSTVLEKQETESDVSEVLETQVAQSHVPEVLEKQEAQSHVPEVPLKQETPKHDVSNVPEDHEAPKHDASNVPEKQETPKHDVPEKHETQPDILDFAGNHDTQSVPLTEIPIVVEDHNDKTESNTTPACSSTEPLVPEEPTLPQVPETSPVKETATEATASLTESSIIPSECVEELPPVQNETSDNSASEINQEVTQETKEIVSSEDLLPVDVPGVNVEASVFVGTSDPEIEKKSDSDEISDSVSIVNEVADENIVPQTEDISEVTETPVVESPESIVESVAESAEAESVDSSIVENSAVDKSEIIASTSSPLPPTVPEKIDLKGLYHCLYCNETFNNGNKKRNHVLSQHPYVRKSHPCVFCKSSSTSFKTNVELFQHLLTTHPTLYFACQSCKERFYSLDDLRDHSFKRHTLDSAELKQLDDRKSEVAEEAPTFTCSACQRIWLFKICFLDHKCNPDKDKPTNPDKVTRLPKLRKVKSMERSDRSDKQMRVDPETMFYSQVSLNVRNNLLHFLDGKLPQEDDDGEIEEDSAAKAPERNMLSFSAGFPGSGLQLIPEPEPYSRVKAQWEKYNFPKNYDGRCGLTSYIKDMSYLDISTQLIMRRNLQRLQGDTEVTSPTTAYDVPSVLALERLATQCAESFGINGIPGGDGETTLGELSGEWVRDRIYICSVCRWETPCLWAMEDHKYEVHPQVLCPQHELVGDQRSLANTIYKRVLPLEEIPFSSEKPNLRSTPVTKVPCTKCGMDGFSSRPELHIHVLACAGEPIPQWAPTPRKKRWKKRRRPRRGLKRNIPSTPHRPIKVRTKPGDTDTIQKMIANLPAKRSTRRVIGFDEADLKTRSQSTIQNITDFQGPVLLPSSRLVLPPSQVTHHKHPKPSSKGSPKTSKDLLIAPPPHVPRGTDLIDTSAERGDVLSSLRMMPVSTPREELLEPRQIIDKVINQKVLGVQNEEASGHPCTGCGQAAESKNALRKHQKGCAYFRECGPNAEHKCKACSRLFDSLVALIEHSCDEMPKLEIEKDLSPVNSAEIPVLSPVQHDGKKGDGGEAAKLNQICGVSFINGKISYETVESIKMSEDGETNLKRKRSHSLGDIPSGKKTFRTGHRRSARLGHAESGPIETPEDTMTSEAPGANTSQVADEDVYESAPEARLTSEKNKTKKLPTRGERSKNETTKKPDINRQVLEIKAMEQSMSRAAQSPSVESESFLDDDSLWEKQAVVAISEDETTKLEVLEEKLSVEEVTEKVVEMPKDEKPKSGGNENKPKFKRRRVKNLRFSTKKKYRHVAKGKLSGKIVSSLGNNQDAKLSEAQSMATIEAPIDSKIEALVGDVVGEMKSEGGIKNEDADDLGSSVAEMTVPDGAGAAKKKVKSVKKGSLKGSVASSSIADTKPSEVEVAPQDVPPKRVKETKVVKKSKGKGALKSKIVVRLKTIGKQGAKGKGLKIKLPKNPKKQVSSDKKKQKDLLSFVNRTPPPPRNEVDLAGKQDSPKTVNDGEDHISMTIDAVVSGTADTLIAIMKSNKLSDLFGSPDEKIDQIPEVATSVEVEKSLSLPSINQINKTEVNSREVIGVVNTAITKKKEKAKNKKMKKASVPLSDAAEKSHGESSIEVVALETKETIEVNKGPAKKSSKKQSKKVNSAVDKAPSVREQNEAGVLGEMKAESKPAQNQKKVKKQSLSTNKATVVKQNEIENVSAGAEEAASTDNQVKSAAEEQLVSGETNQDDEDKKKQVEEDENQVSKKKTKKVRRVTQNLKVGEKDEAVNIEKDAGEQQFVSSEKNEIVEDKVGEDENQGSKKKSKKGRKITQSVNVEEKDESMEIEKSAAEQQYVSMNQIDEDSVGGQDENQNSKKKGKKGRKVTQSVNVEEKEESVESEKPVLRRRSGKSSLMAELVQEALLGLDSEGLELGELPLRTTRSKRSSLKLDLGISDAENAHEGNDGEIPDVNDSEVVPRVTRRKFKKDVAEMKPKEDTAELKELAEIEPPTVTVIANAEAVIADAESIQQDVEKEDEPLVRKLAPPKLKKPTEKANKKKGPIETSIDEDEMRRSIEVTSDDNKKGSIDATIDDVINEFVRSTDPNCNTASLPSEEGEVNDKSKKSKKRPTKKAYSKVSADEIRPNIFYPRLSVTGSDVESKDSEIPKDVVPSVVALEPAEDLKLKKLAGKRSKRPIKAVEESEDVNVSETKRENFPETKGEDLSDSIKISPAPALENEVLDAEDSEVSRNVSSAVVVKPLEDLKPKKLASKRSKRSLKAEEESNESKDVSVSESKQGDSSELTKINPAAVLKDQVLDANVDAFVSNEIVPGHPQTSVNAQSVGQEIEERKEGEKPADSVSDVKEKSSTGATHTQQNTPQAKPSLPFKNKLLSGRLPSAEKAAALLSRKPLHQVEPPTSEEPKKRKIFSYQKKNAPARRLTRSNSNGKSDPKGEPVIDPYDYNEDEIVPFHEPRYKPYSPPKPVLYAPPPTKRRVRKREDSPDTTTIVVQAEVHPEPPPRRRVNAPSDDKTAATLNDHIPTTTSEPNPSNKRKSVSPHSKDSLIDRKKPRIGTCYDGIDVLEDEDSGSSPPQLVPIDEPDLAMPGTADRLSDSAEAQKVQSAPKVAQWANVVSPLRSVSPVKKDELPNIALSPRGSTPTGVSSPRRTASPGGTASPARMASPARVSTPAKMASPARISSPAGIASPARISSPARTTSPARVASPARMASPARVASPARLSSSPLSVVSPSRLSPIHTSLPLRSYGRVSKPMSPPSEPPELVDESKVTVEEKFDADSSSPILQPAAGPLSDLFDSEPPALERTGDLTAFTKNTSVSEEDTETAVDTEEDNDSMKSFKTFKKKGKDLKLIMKKQLMRLKALKNKKKKDLKKSVGGTRKEVVNISGMAWEVSELAVSPSKSEPPPPPASVLPIIKDWDASDLWDSPIVNAVPISAPGPIAVSGMGSSGSPADPSPTHPSMPPMPSSSPAPRNKRSDSSGSTTIPSLGSILDSVNKLLNEPENNFSSLPPQYSLADLQRAMGASDAEMAVLEQLGEASCLTDFDESLRPVVANAHLDDEWIMDLDNQAAQQPIVSSSVVESPPAGTPPPEATAPQSLPLTSLASNSSSSSSIPNTYQSRFNASEFTGFLKQGPSKCKSLQPQPPSKCSSSLLAAHGHKEVVCPTCSCHFMGFPALQIHVNKVHGSQHDPTQVTGSLQNRRVVLESGRSTSRLVCFECNQILSSHLMHRHLELDHSLEPDLVSRCSTVTGDLHEGPVVGERLKSKMTSALGELLDKAVTNILIAKNKPEAANPSSATGLSSNAVELLNRLCAMRKRDTSRIKNSKDMSFNKLKMSEPGPVKTDDEWARPFPNRPFLCTTCGQRFPLAASRNKHEALAHKAFRNMNKTNLNDDDYYDDEDDDWRDAPSPESAFEDGGGCSLTPTCSDCGLSFDSVSDLMRHRVEDHAPRRRLSIASESGMESAAPVSSSTAPISAPRRISSASRSQSLDNTSPPFDMVADSDDSCSTTGTKSASGAHPPSRANSSLGTDSPIGTNSPVGTSSTVDPSSPVDSPPASKKSRLRAGKFNTVQVSKIKAEAALRQLNGPR